MTAPPFQAAELIALGRDPDRLRRQCRFIARLDARLGGQRPHERPIIVGDTAVEFYTTGGYASQDVDLALFDPVQAEDLLARSDFQREGRHWWSASADLLIEFPGRTLNDVPDAYDRLWEVEIDPGQTVLIIGLEDIVMGRIYSGISEGRVKDLKWAFEMLSVQFDQLDRNALMSLAQRNGMQQATEHLLGDAERIRQKSTTP